MECHDRSREEKREKTSEPTMKNGHNWNENRDMKENMKWVNVTFYPHDAPLFILVRHFKLVNDFCNILWSHIGHL